jgi:glucose/arabinose dehydrogenase
VFDYYHDLITDLPGSSGVFQNNGIAFDKDGHVYLTVGVCSDHEPTRHPYEGTMLKAKPDGSHVTVFARGLRNPYDVIVGPDGEIFCTDNDSEARNDGNSLFHVQQGKHYGHPYNQGPPGFTVPGLPESLLPHPSDEVVEGLDYAAPGSLPAPFDDSLYIASLWHGKVLRMKLHREGSTYRGKPEPFARVPFPLDVCVSPRDGTMYVLCGLGNPAVYRIVSNAASDSRGKNDHRE